MKFIVLTTLAVLPSNLAAGTLIKVTESGEVSSSVPSAGLDGTSAIGGLRAQGNGLGLRGHAQATSLTAISAPTDLHGEGVGQGTSDGDVLTGFVELPPPPPPEIEMEVEGPPTPEPQPEPDPEPLTFELRDLTFEDNSSKLKQSEIPVIAELAAIIEQVGSQSVILIGHTDRRGTAEYNLRLSKQRAIAVRNALVEWHDVSPSLFSVIGRGEQDLISKGISDADHAQDRRVVVVLED